MYTTIICDQIEKYRKATKKEKGVILDNLCSVTNRSRDSVSRTLRNRIGYNRYAIKKSQNKGNKKPLRRRKPGRLLKYSKEIDAALEYIWKAYNYPYLLIILSIMSVKQGILNLREAVHPKRMIIAI